MAIRLPPGPNLQALPAFKTLICLALLGFNLNPVLAQTEWQNLQTDWLSEVMPGADSFSAKQGNPPVISAFRTDPASTRPELVGYVFTTPDLPPEEAGFSGPVHMLIGMDLDGQITGLRILYYRESYRTIRGDFIVNSGFVEQFPGKSVEEGFQVGRDIDGMSRATISSWAVARGLRNASRRVAEAYLPQLNFVVEASAETTALQSLRNQSWQDYIDSGFVKELAVPIENGADLQLAIAYMGHYRLGELLVGAADYSNADRTASSLLADGHMLLIALDGNSARLRQRRLGIMQNNSLFPNQEDRVVFAGTAEQGKIAGQAQYAVAMFIDPAVDITQPFQLVYDTGERTGEFSEFLAVDYELSPEVLTLISGMPPELMNTDAGWLSSALLLICFFLALLFVRLKQIKQHRQKRP
ncbi:MAG: FMN-binding protein [Gammaproteobacteria bacterium]|nr:FMN-binding protein [Gammaproteobacteria bacterium]